METETETKSRFHYLCSQVVTMKQDFKLIFYWLEINTIKLFVLIPKSSLSF